MTELEVVIAHIGDPCGVLHRLRVVGEETGHLLLALYIELVRLETQAGGVGEAFLHGYAHEDVLIRGVLFFDVVRIVRERKGDARLTVYAQKALGRTALLRQSVVLNFKVKAVPAEQCRQLLGLALCPLVVATEQHFRYCTRNAAGQTNKPLAMLRQQLPVDPRLSVKALGEGAGDDVAQIFVARLVFAQQYEVAVIRVDAVFPIEAGAWRNVDLAADDGLYALGDAGLVKCDGAVHDAVVGYRSGGLPQLL